MDFLHTCYSFQEQWLHSRAQPPPGGGTSVPVKNSCRPTNPPNRYRLLLRIAVKMVDESISTHDLGSARINLSAAIADKSSRTSAGLTREAWGQMCQSFLRKMADGWIERLMAQPPPLFLKHFPFSFRIMSLISFVIILPDDYINSRRRIYESGRNLRIRIEELVVDFKENLFENNKISMMGKRRRVSRFRSARLIERNKFE